MKQRLRGTLKTFGQQHRDPRYVFVLVSALIIFTICFLQVRTAGLFDSFEKPVFHFFNNLPAALYDPMVAITQLGSLGGLILWIPLAWYLVHRRAAVTVLGTGFVAWTLAKVAKVLAHRGRPHDLLAHVHIFTGEEKLTGYGFPSGHSTLSAACVTILYYQVAPKYRKYLLLVVLMVGVSRLYLGAHFPLDVVGGWALGALIGSAIILVCGMPAKAISVVRLKHFLNTRNWQIKHLKFAHVDARGSRPLFIVTESGKEYFGKLFGKQEHAADWLFKIFRFFRYKNLQAEEPYISSRRNVEIEAFAMLWARQAGVRVARVIDIIRYGSYWISIQEKIDAKPLSESRRVSQKSLIDTWRQVKILHKATIAHRDLRAANILIDKQGRAYIIDFGFAEVSASRQRLHMDTAELLMSMSLVAGVKRTVAAARKVLSGRDLKEALPYLQSAVFSGATAKLLKENKPLLSELKETLKKELNIKQEIEQAEVLRINRRKLINLVLFAVFVYVVAPQFGAFRDAFRDTDIASVWWFVPLAIASILTYVLTGLIYVALAPVPLKIRDASLVQLAASFVSKVVPGGLGSTTLNGKYLTKAGMDPLETSAVIAAQGVIGFLMFMVPLGIFLALNGTNIFKLIHVHVSLLVLIILAAIIIMGGIVCAVVQKLRQKIVEKVLASIEQLRSITTPPRELAIAAIASLAVTAAYVFCLYAALQSIGIRLGVSEVIIAYALAVIAKSTIPTPGGLGPVEAAMIGTLVGFDVPKVGAISAVLVYRLATFWIPVPLSLWAYKVISKRRLI